jgi:hypothetical protein
MLPLSDISSGISSPHAYPVIIHHTQAYPVLTDPTQAYPVRTDHTEPYPVLTDHTEPYPVLTDPTQAYPVLTDHTEPYPVLSGTIPHRSHSVIFLRRCQSVMRHFPQIPVTHAPVHTDAVLTDPPLPAYPRKSAR